MERVKGILMNNPNIKRIAQRMAALIPESYRLGKEFWYWYAFFEESEKWDLAQVREYQIYKLKELLSELATTSKFYKERLSSLDINKISSLDEFCFKVPTLTKTEFRDAYNDILSVNYEKNKCQKSQTSGTTGSALPQDSPSSRVPTLPSNRNRSL